MKMNVLITGFGGFIGKHLIAALSKNNKVNVLYFNRENSLNDLKTLLLQSNKLVHLAGEVRPQSSDDAFYNSNVGLTQTILSILEENKHFIPIIYISSIHAEKSANAYGKTKRKSELLIEAYDKKENTDSSIFRLPHVFGRGCRTNYNSVISTWIVNTIENKEIIVYDENIKMNYVYVDDIVNEFVEELFLDEGDRPLYRKPKISFDTTLGNIIRYLEEFKTNILNDNYHIEKNEFKEKLYSTYQDYYCKKGY
jgi:UDP-2-acetamido-2,6-beta-L-arabino-hexul-4-ose reductase